MRIPMERIIASLFVIILALAFIQPKMPSNIEQANLFSEELDSNIELDNQLNPVTINETIKIASFNIQIFGKSKSAKEDVMGALVDIVKKYDVIAIQEIKDISQETPHMFLEKINQNGTKYGMVLSDRTGLHENDKTSQEQYAVFYNEEKIVALDEGELYNDSQYDFFQREPLITQLSTLDGRFTFVMQVIHTKPSSAIEEIDALHEVFEWSKLKYDNETNFIMLGDFNAGCSYASPEELDLLEIRSENYTWIIPDSADTNLAQSVCAYDRIVISNEINDNFTGNWGVESTFTNDSISDHWPIWFEISV